MKARVSLVTGLPGPARAAEIARLLEAFTGPSTVILEGAMASGEPEIIARPGVTVHVLAPGCMCCVGNLPLRVTLARALRLEHPEHVLLGIADATHRSRIVEMLAAPAYAAFLDLSALEVL